VNCNNIKLICAMTIPSDKCIIPDLIQKARLHPYFVTNTPRIYWAVSLNFTPNPAEKRTHQKKP
jgi:hypothetical protein